MDVGKEEFVVGPDEREGVGLVEENPSQKLLKKTLTNSRRARQKRCAYRLNNALINRLHGHGPVTSRAALVT